MSSARDVTVSKSALPDGAALEATLGLLNAKVVPDGITNAIRTIDYEHHEIHDGRHYRVQANATAAALVIAFKVGSQSREPHLVFEWSSESSGYIQLLEGATWDTNTGTRRSFKQSNRNSANASIMEGDGTGAGGFVAGECVIDPTTVAGGTVISDKRFYSDKKAGGADGERRNEIVLEPGVQYCLCFTSTDGAKGIQMRTSHYEHAPGSYT
jgi:hypothetical protein